MNLSIEAAYQPRHVAVVDPIADDHWNLKAYWMSIDGAPADELVIRLAVEAALAALAGEEGHGPGFVIVHRGAVADWIVLCWWSDQDILRRKVLVHDDGAIRDRSDEHFLACVWELSVVDWERKAWINTILRHPESADSATYLAAVYPSAFC